MSVFFRIYRDATLTDRELDEQTTFTVGSGKKDTVQVEDCGFGKKQFTFTREEKGWRWTSAKPVPIRGGTALSGVIEPGETLLADRDRHIAVTVLERDENDVRLVDLARHSEVTVGRSGECDIVVAGRQISGKHLTLRRTAEGWTACDLRSSNGTYRNGERLTAEAVLVPGDVLDLGPCRLILTGDSLSVAFRGGVKSNLPDALPVRTAQSPEDPYPFLFHRSPRLKEEIPAETIEFQDAPSIGGKPTISWFSVIVPPLLSVGVMALASFLLGGAMTMLVFSAPMTLVGIVMSVVSYRHQVKEYRRMEQLRLDKYDAYLEEQEQAIRRAQSEQRRILTDIHPPTVDCLTIASQPARRLWERRRTDADFLELRAGEGAVDSCVGFQVPRHGLSLVKDDQEDRAGELAGRYASVPHCPITCPLGAAPTCGIIGQRESALNVARNMLVQAATHHSYEDLRIVLLFPRQEAAQWSFARWLPHINNDTGTERYIADSPDSARRVLDQVSELLASRMGRQDPGREKAPPEGPHFLVICADRTLLAHHPIGQYLAANDPALGVSALFLYDELDLLPKECGTILAMEGRKGCLFQKENAGTRQEFLLDPVKEDFYDAFARAMAPLRIEAATGKGSLPTSVSFLQGFGVCTPGELAGPAHWAEAAPERSMAVPIGVRAGGEAFLFDIHEKKSGPHGLVAGMTGSGKSEMVQSWILSMALAFPPQAASFVLIDFKGTGLILPFRNLPHLAGTISDLDTNITRNLIALENELTRRKALLDAASVSNISGYLRLYREGKVKEPLSYLFLIIDEFAEFKVQFPEFMQVVNRVFAIGRTLGVHIVLLTQKPGSVVDDKMNANTRFRWCLKVASSADSQEMLRHPDAARITNPGRAYVQVGEDEVYEQIQSYWSGAPYNPDRALGRQRADKLSVVDLYGFKHSYEPEKTTGFRADKNEIDAVVEYLDQYARDNGVPRARNIWTSRLPEHIELPQLLHIGFDGDHWGENEGLAPVVGMLDDPRTQSQYPLRLDLPRDGHTVIYGAPGVGKTTFLQTFVLSTALSYSPREVSIYLLDFGGGSLNLFRDLPHVGAVVRDSEAERLDKVCRIVTGELDRRKSLFAEMGIVSIAAFREASKEPMPYLVLAVDNFAPVLSLYPDMDEFFQTLTREGGSYGIYLVATAGGENAVPYRIAQNLKGGVALRMPDASDYASIVGRTGGLDPENFPGRGLFRGKPPLEFQAALPAAGEGETQRAQAIRELARRMDEKWDGERPQDVPIMPARVLAGEWNTDGLLLGLDRTTVRPVDLDLIERQFLLVSHLGGGEGKRLLRAAAAQLPGRWRQEDITLYDPAERVLEKLREGCSYITAPAEFDGCVAALMPLLQKRKESVESDQGRAWLEQQPPIILIISDLKACLEAASPDTARRLASILHLGAGLRVSVVVLARAQDRDALCHAGDMFSIHLTNKADVVMVEGCLRDHGMFDTQLDYTEAGEPLAEGDAWLLQDGVARRIKCVEHA